MPQSAPSPSVPFRYSVTIDNTGIGFSEASGLTLEHEVFKDRDGKNAQWGEIKMPGRPKVSDVTLKKGLCTSDNRFYEWIMKCRNTLECKDISVNLLDEEGKPRMIWKLLKAWPAKIEEHPSKGDSNEVVIESITLAYEEIRMETR
ncbi:phage tail protein [Desulfovibrio sp. OttesenSCG-928-C06]|nr:phage tail protein [Desulfovibrio sp. OttesenSCG-928-C06]